MTDSEIAVAAFVKCPLYSPVKTRLAAAIGRDQAATFYQHCCQCLPELFGSRRSQYAIDFFWAVAEEQASSFWQGRQVLQGSGGLGARMAKVYNELLMDYSSVILIGGDTPQLDDQIIQDAIRRLAQHDFVVGPCEDGGFYLFGGHRPVEKEIWESVSYSCSQTLSQLLEKITAHGRVARLASLFDVDTIEELKRLGQALMDLPERSQAQVQLGIWLVENGYHQSH